MQMKEMKDGFRETLLKVSPKAELPVVTHSNINEAAFPRML